MTAEIRRMSDGALMNAYIVGDLTNPERWFLIGQEVMRRGLMWTNLAA